MATMEVSKASGSILSWAVALSVGGTFGPPVVVPHRNSKGGTIYLNSGMEKAGLPFRPADEWRQGGPLCESAGICVRVEWIEGRRRWCAYKTSQFYTGEARHIQYGETELEARLRCLVFAELGDTFEVPDALLT